MSNGVFIIYGLTKEGKSCKPSNWPERFSAKLMQNEEQYFDSFVYPVYKEGVKSLAVSHLLEKFNPSLHEEILTFAKSKNLQIK